ncbi:MAG TPA: TIGR03621 family F420-dependent LLM class oxidoreductase [Acidimicrobiales bacterium]
MGHPRPFRFGVQLANARSGAEWAEMARRAEDLGYSTVFVPDHFDDILAPVPALMAAAAATTTLKVAPLVLDNDYKHPVVTAKELATIDLLSDGRLEVGLGAGWMASDYEQSGIPMDEPSVRVDRLEEAVTIIKGLFGEGPVDFEGTHYRISGLDGRPKPVQRPHPPFLIGGGRPRTLRLAAREADIVGVNPSIKSGRTDAAAARDGAAEQTDRKLRWLREAAGDRYDDIEINFLIFACVVTDDRKGTIEAMAPLFGLSPDDVADYPHAWVGSVDQICEHLEAGRERWDASYLVVQGVEAMTAAAPIVARLAGT